MATHSRVLACEIPWTEEPGGLHFRVLQRIRYNLTKELSEGKIKINSCSLIVHTFPNLA